MIMDSESDSSVDHCLGWDTDDELEMDFFRASESNQDALSSSSTNSKFCKVEHFVAMNFPEKMVIQAIKENGEENDDDILNTLLTYVELEKIREQDPCASSMLISHSEDCLYDLSDGDSACVEEKGSIILSIDKDRTISLLLDMGYRLENAVAAIEKCGADSPLEELTDFIYAMETARRTAIDLPKSSLNSQIVKKRDLPAHASLLKKRKTISANHVCKQPLGSSERLNSSESLSLPSPMIGFGVPGMTLRVSRQIPHEVSGRPYFYYENVAFTPKGVWGQISRFLYDIQPEFVDSVHFSAAARKRGYIHNLPIENRRPLLPIPPKTIHEALPETRKWWPKWDKRTKLNCLLTCIGSAQLTERIRKRVENWDVEPPESDQKYVIQQCKKWNLVWVGKNKVAVLEPDDLEMLLGFPKNHTRGGGVSRTDRYKVLGNSFQVDTVAYHLSVLKPLFPSGINVLSLFSGIGGAEVALHRLGNRMKNVVSVEISPINQKILQDWWEETEQTGNLIHIVDVQEVDNSMIDKWIKDFNGFDLVIGGSPCNNLSGGNRRTRDGLEGQHSSLFFHYYRILERVQAVMRGR